MIAEAAYFRAERRGFSAGHELADWLEAEAEVDATLRHSDLCDSDILQSIRNLVSAGSANVSREVRLFTLRAFANGLLGGDRLRSVGLAVITGAEQGALQIAGRNPEAWRGAIEGLENALSDLAEACRLAIEEAQGHAAEFFQDELHRVAEALRALKLLLGDVLVEDASTGGVFAENSVHDLAQHVRMAVAQFAGQIDEIVTRFGGHVQAGARDMEEKGKQVVQEQKEVSRELMVRALRVLIDRLEGHFPKDPS